MGRYQFRLPDVGEGVAEAEVVHWHVRPGDTVLEDQRLVDVMTDKATIEMSSPVEGVVTALYGEPGRMAPVGAVLVELEIDGEGNATALSEEPAPRPVPAPSPPELALEAAPPAGAGSGRASSTAPAMALPVRAAVDPPCAAPATRRRAYELGIPLQYVRGTGPGGRILPADLDAFIAGGGLRAEPSASAPFPRAHVTDTRIIGLRRRIAERMQDAKRRIPHITYVEECDLTELEALRADLNARHSGERPKLTLLPFLMRALVRTLPDFPHVNARYDDEAGVLHEHSAVHIGIATQTPAGLMVSVVRHAEARDLWDCAAELARVSAAARNGAAAPADLSGSTITITSLGSLGGVVTTPIINHPEVAIIGPNKLVDRPTVRGPFVTVRKMMNLSSSFDHRIVDGYDAARFVQSFRRLLEHPSLIFMD